MNNNPEYHASIDFDFKDIDDFGKKLGNILTEAYARSLDGHFEEREVMLGCEININEGAYFEDGFIKGRVGETIIEPAWLQ